MVKNLPTDAGDSGLTPGLGRKEGRKETVTHSSILAWEKSWTEEPGRYSPWGHKRARHSE